MKTAKSVFGIITITIAWLATGTSSVAEMFYGPTSTTNRFLIATNQAVLIDSTLSTADPVNLSIIVSNVSYSTTIDIVSMKKEGGVPFAFGGPSELVFSVPVAVRFIRLTNSPIKMLIWDGKSSTVTASVPQGRTIEFFFPTGSGGDYYRDASLVAGQLTYGGQNSTAIRAGQRFEGPMTIQFPTGFLDGPTVFGSYWFIEDVFQNPNGGLVVGQGTPTIVIERSGDLTNWQAVGAFGAGVGSNTFYRLNISQ